MNGLELNGLELNGLGLGLDFNYDESSKNEFNLWAEWYIEFGSDWIAAWFQSLLNNEEYRKDVTFKNIHQSIIKLMDKVDHVKDPLVMIQPFLNRFWIQVKSKLYPSFYRLFRHYIIDRIGHLLPFWLEEQNEEIMSQFRELDSLASIMNLTAKFKTRNMLERDLVNRIHLVIQEKIASQINFEESNLDTYLEFIHNRIKPIFQSIFGQDSSMMIKKRILN